MSVFLGVADGLAATLAEVESLSGIDIIVDRQKELDVKLRKSIAKKKGIGIIIFFSSARNSDQEDPTPQFENTYLVTVWSKPVIRKDETSSDEIVQTICQELHHWIHDGDDCYQRAKASTVRLVPHAAYLVYEITIKIPIRL